MNALEIQSLINAKEKRQFILEERKKKIEQIEENLSINFWGTTFKGFLLLTKKRDFAPSCCYVNCLFPPYIF